MSNTRPRYSRGKPAQRSIAHIYLVSTRALCQLQRLSYFTSLLPEIVTVLISIFQGSEKLTDWPQNTYLQVGSWEETRSFPLYSAVSRKEAPALTLCPRHPADPSVHSGHPRPRQGVVKSPSEPTPGGCSAPHFLDVRSCHRPLSSALEKSGGNRLFCVTRPLKQAQKQHQQQS